MTQFFLRIWFLVGSAGLIIVTLFFIVIVRVAKFFMGRWFVIFLHFPNPGGKKLQYVARAGVNLNIVSEKNSTQSQSCPRHVRVFLSHSQRIILKNFKLPVVIEFFHEFFFLSCSDIKLFGTCVGFSWIRRISAQGWPKLHFWHSSRKSDEIRCQVSMN